MPSSSDLHARLDRLYQTWQKLRPKSPEELFSEFSAFFNESCTAWLGSMREWASPSIGRQAAIDSVKKSLKMYHLEERRVVSRTTSEAELKAVCEMKNSYNVGGKLLDPLYQTVVVTFNEEGLITDFKSYCCQSHIMLVAQTVTGLGPYKAGYLKNEWEEFKAHNEGTLEGNENASVGAECCP